MTSTKYSCGNEGNPAEDVLAGSSLAKKARRGQPGGNQPGAPAAEATGELRSEASQPSLRSPESPVASSRAARGCKKRGARSLAWHDFAVVLGQLVPLLVIALAVFTVALPVSTAAIPDVSIFNLDYTHDQMKFRFWMDELTYPVVLGAAVFGVAAGVRAFRFLLVKCETTAVLSLPMPRVTLFATRFSACLLVLAVGIGVPLAASLLVNIVALSVWPGLFEQCAYVFFGLFVTAAVACALSVVACTVAGTLAEAVAFALALLTGVTVAAWGMGAVMDYLLLGNAAGEHLLGGSTEVVAPSLVDAWAQANPLLFFANEAQAHYRFIVQHPVYYPVAGTWLLVGAWALAVCALAALAAALVRRRKGERAGIAGLSVPLSVIVGIVIGVAAFGAAFTLMAGLSVPTAIVASFLVFWAVSFVLFRGPLRGSARMGRTLAVLGGETVVLACVVACLGTGGLGFASFVPAADDVESVSVSYTGSPDYLAVGFKSAKAGDGAYYFSAEYSFSDEEAVNLVREVHGSLAQMGHVALAEDRTSFQGTVVPYDVVIRYELRDGSEVVRYYDRARLSDLAELASLDGTARARELARAAVSGDISLLSDDDAANIGSSVARQAYALGNIYVSDRLYSAPMLVNCDAQARGELLSALAEDVANQSVEDRYHPDAPCRGVIMFTQAGETAADTFAYGVENTVIYLTDEFSRTLAWFDAKGLSPYLSVGGADGAAAAASVGEGSESAEVASAAEASKVESLTFQRFAPYAGMNAVTDPQSAYFMGYKATTAQQFISMQDFGTKFSTSDASEIAELLPLTRNAYYLDGGGFLVSAKLKGQEAYAYLFIPAADAPEWLVRVAGA